MTMAKNPLSRGSFAITTFAALGAMSASTPTARSAVAPLAESPSGKEDARVATERVSAIDPAGPGAAFAIGAAEPFRGGFSDASSPARALECLAQAVYYEGATEPLEGQQGIAQVILNRVSHPAFPDSVCGVVYEGAERSTGCQFTFTCDGSLARRPSEALWARARRTAQAALGGFVADQVGRATHYHADYVDPYWSASLDRIDKVGLHIFYVWRGTAGKPEAFEADYAGIEPDKSAFAATANSASVKARSPAAAETSAIVPGPSETVGGAPGKGVPLKEPGESKQAMKAFRPRPLLLEK